MARKDKSKNAHLSPATAVNGSRSSIHSRGSSAAGTDEPTFSGDILKKLQQKIQVGMEKVNAESSSGTSKPQLQAKSKEKANKKSKEGKKERSDRPEKKPVPKLKNDVSIPPKPAKAEPSEPRGKKRGRNGENIPGQEHSSERHAAVNGSGKPTPKGKGRKGKLSDEDLLREILELGGSREDLDLIKGIDSDNEEEVTIMGREETKEGKSLRSEIEKLMAEMGHDVSKSAIEQVVDDDEVSDGPNEDMENGDGEEERTDDDKEDKEEADEDDAEENSWKKASQDISEASSRHSSNKLLFSPRPDWHAFGLPKLPESSAHPGIDTIEALHVRGKNLLKKENEIYSATHLIKSSDRQFLSTIMTSGTLSDKVSALTLICQESPLHTTKTLETLLSLAKKKSRSQAVAALTAVKDLFASGLVLPQDRKLKPFSKQPSLACKEVTDLHLLVWSFEDWLKSFYFEVLQVLEGLCSDQLEFARSHAVGYVWELLQEKPEQEANLLRLLVNKLGDKEKKVASKVSFLLLQLQQTHPAMKSIIINAIESEVLFRPGNSPHAKYYAIITLNQTIMSVREVDIANRLLDIYFAVFTSLLTKTEDSQAKPLSNGNAKRDEKGKAKLSKKAQRKLEEALKLTQAEEELNAKLISAILTGVNRAFPFSKVNDELFQKHIDTLFRITHSGNFNTGIQALMLIHQVSVAKQVVSDRFYRTLYESLFDQRLINSSKQPMYLNLLFKAIKGDPNIKRVQAFVKRLVQISLLHQPAFICGVFYLLSELEATIPSLRMMLDSPEVGEDDEEEIFRDAPDEDDDAEKGKLLALDQAKRAAEKSMKNLSNVYDARKRNPEHANADKSCLWEIIPYLAHFHPSVSLFASSFLLKKKMPPKPDLSLHTLTHFLDRFVFRNPSAKQATRGPSLMQPLPGAAAHTRGMVLAIRGVGKAQASVNNEEFWTQKVEDVAADEVFFHKYFNERGKPAKKKAEQARNMDEDSDDGGEDQIWKALVGSAPELEMDGDEDVDMDDLDMTDESISDEDSSMNDNGDSGEGSDSDEEDGLTLDSAIAASRRGDDIGEQDSDESDDGLDPESEGSDVWGSDDDIDLPSDIGMGDALSPRPAETKKEKKKNAKSTKSGKDDDEEDGKKRKKRKLSNLPTFASADDYAHLLSD